MNDERHLGQIIKNQRVANGFTLNELSKMSGVSASHIGRIERGDRFPSARILKLLAKPLGFNENELFTLANYLSPTASAGESAPRSPFEGLDPYVARVLSQEPVQLQRAIIGLLAILKSLANMTERERRTD